MPFQKQRGRVDGNEGLIMWAAVSIRGSGVLSSGSYLSGDQREVSKEPFGYLRQGVLGRTAGTKGPETSVY